MWTRQQVAATIDHAALKPNMTDQDIATACELGRKYKVATVCVRPSDVALAARLLAGSGVAPAAVVGFAHGANQPQTKALEARLAIADGARELDMVVNIGKLLSGDDAWVQRDIAAVVAEARPAGALVKVILETCLLTSEQIAQGCRLAQRAGADFVKTSTGFSDGGATREAIEVMLKTVGATMGVKASGGIRTWDTAIAYLNQGCRRLGVASTAQVLDGAPAPAGGGY
jgi:deoxyribose-phosphate aldolase